MCVRFRQVSLVGPNQIGWKSLCERLWIERFLVVFSNGTLHGSYFSDSCYVLRVVLAY